MCFDAMFVCNDMSTVKTLRGACLEKCVACFSLTVLQAFQGATSGEKMQSGRYARRSEVGFVAVWFGEYGCWMRILKCCRNVVHFSTKSLGLTPYKGKHSPVG